MVRKDQVVDSIKPKLVRAFTLNADGTPSMSPRIVSLVLRLVPKARELQGAELQKFCHNWYTKPRGERTVKGVNCGKDENGKTITRFSRLLGKRVPEQPHVNGGKRTITARNHGDLVCLAEAFSHAGV